MPVTLHGTNGVTFNDASIQDKAARAPGTAPSYTARGWANFNGVGAVAVRSSANMSSISDNTTGDFTANLTAAVADANHATFGEVGSNNGTGFSYASAILHTTTSASARVLYPNQSNGVLYDQPLVTIGVVR